MAYFVLITHNWRISWTCSSSYTSDESGDIVDGFNRYDRWMVRLVKSVRHTEFR